ncbi:hypothetical protein HJC23_011781 [Cyclotella cryptica]|uniref:Uncharacterized protein n=1 Tax=Cyclotella cryptica TaxID=29204 RepID=A0ABD3PHW8_9STRA
MKSTALISAAAAAFSFLNVAVTTAFTASPNGKQSSLAIKPSGLYATSSDSFATSSLSTRRSFFTTTTATLVASTLAPLPSHASDEPPTPEEIARIKKGYENIRYLLSNWEQETTVCRENGGECKRDADAVRRYLGLRSTKDPLFQIEKVFAKVKNMEGIDVDKLEEFFEATEDWIHFSLHRVVDSITHMVLFPENTTTIHTHRNTAMNMSNSMAFISQFGEYNPGGGKDEVLKYLNESQNKLFWQRRH